MGSARKQATPLQAMMISAVFAVVGITLFVIMNQQIVAAFHRLSIREALTNAPRVVGTVTETAAERVPQTRRTRFRPVIRFSYLNGAGQSVEGSTQASNLPPLLDYRRKDEALRAVQAWQPGSSATIAIVSDGTAVFEPDKGFYDWSPPYAMMVFGWGVTPVFALTGVATFPSAYRKYKQGDATA